MKYIILTASEISFFFQAILPDLVVTTAEPSPFSSFQIKKEPNIGQQEKKEDDEPVLDRYSSSIDQKMKASEELVSVKVIVVIKVFFGTPCLG